MLKFKRLAMALLIAASAAGLKAGCLWIAGDALSYGWSLDNATALLSTPDNADVFTGTVYLKGGQDFKFLTTPDFGNEEYGAAPDAALVDGRIYTAKGKNDEGYGKLRVTEDANYLISVDTRTLTAYIAKSVYQVKPVNLCSLFLVGDATPNGWDVMKGTPLYQDNELPYCFAASGIELVPGSFKIATVLKGAGTFSPEYWYFRNAENSDKIALNQEGDLQWSISAADKYSVSVNLDTEAISISKDVATGIGSLASEDADAVAEYYTLAGIRVENPHGGVFVRRCGATVTKLVVR